MKTLLITACGLSSRFEGLRPKWLLTHPKGNIMLTEALSGLDFSQFNKICFSFLQEHFTEYECSVGIEKAISELGVSDISEIHLFQERTKDQAETTYKSLKHFKIEGSFLVKEVDNYFEYDCTQQGNVVCYCDLNQTTKINPTNKGYVVFNGENTIKEMVEKRVASTSFSCGAYQFESASLFNNAYEQLSKRIDGGLYLSKVIDFLIKKGERFTGTRVNNYLDWGTKEDWFDYCRQFATVFSDLDGTLLTSSGEYFKPYWEEAQPIQENIDTLNELHDSGKIKIIITTARKKSAKEMTINQLKKFDIKYDEIIFGLSHCQRILINDFSTSNPYPSARALNLKRNSNNLNDFF